VTRGRVITVAILLLATAALVIWFLNRAPDPTYHGLRLSEWLTYYNPHLSQENKPQVDDAIRHIGTNALPTILNKLRSKDSFPRRAMIQWEMKNQSFAISDEDLQWEAARAFEALGPVAKSTVPQLIQIFHEQISTNSQMAVLYSLGAIGPDAETAIPLLCQCVTNSATDFRDLSLQSLGQIHSQTNTVVPVLTHALNDPNTSVRTQARIALERFGIKAP
jgi:hypothetical protein